MKYVLPKGFIAVDGISLTVGEVGPDCFAVYLIPETLRVTTLGGRAEGDAVNLEVEAQTQVLHWTAAASMAQVLASTCWCYSDPVLWQLYHTDVRNCTADGLSLHGCRPLWTQWRTWWRATWRRECPHDGLHACLFPSRFPTVASLAGQVISSSLNSLNGV